MLGEGELAPGLHRDEFAARRAALAAAMPPGSVALLAAAPVNHMVGVIPFPYRQVRDNGDQSLRKRPESQCHINLAKH